MREKIIKKNVFWFSVLSAILLFLSIALGQKIFAELWLIHEMIQLLVLLFFCVTLSWSLVFWLKKSDYVKVRYVPLVIHVIMVAIIVILPLNWLRNEIEFNNNRDQFEKAALFVMEKEVEETGHPEIFELPEQYKYLSLDGVVFVIHKQNKKGVFFFTFRGAPDGVSGFLKLQSGADLKEFSKAITAEHLTSKDLEDNWYYLSAE
jgi:hypothetical protein